MDAATRIVLSYPADLSAWGRRTVEGSPFRAYLRTAHETAAEGDAWAEFVGVGCCGDALDVPLVVEEVEGGTRVNSGTEFDFRERESCGIEGGWRVQSAAGPAAGVSQYDADVSHPDAGASHSNARQTQGK